VSLSTLECTGAAETADVACWSVLCAEVELEAMEAAVASASPLISAALVS